MSKYQDKSFRLQISPRMLYRQEIVELELLVSQLLE